VNPDSDVNRALQNAGQDSSMYKRASSAAKSKSWSSGGAATESTVQYPRGNAKEPSHAPEEMSLEKRVIKEGR
jgi:hypothetical protein